MELQQGISLKKNQAFVGRTLDVLVEGQGEGEMKMAICWGKSSALGGVIEMRRK